MRELADKNLLILYTVRDGKYLQDAVDWFRYNHINLYSVNYNPEPVSSSPKVYCDYYIDDRNIGTPLTDKGYVDWDKMLVLLRQKKFCFKGYYYVEVKEQDDKELLGAMGRVVYE